jgi:hypothetical protein
METIPDKKFRSNKLLSLITLSIGVLLMVFMIITEDEPGALPLLLIIIGTGWYFISWFRKE